MMKLMLGSTGPLGTMVDTGVAMTQTWERKHDQAVRTMQRKTHKLT